jgi:hypothetical protein
VLVGVKIGRHALILTEGMEVMAKKLNLAEFNRQQARELGARAWDLRRVARCPYKAGSELADIWHAARDEARKATERPEVKDEIVPVQNAVDLLLKGIGRK